MAPQSKSQNERDKVILCTEIISFYKDAAQPIILTPVELVETQLQVQTGKQKIPEYVTQITNFELDHYDKFQKY